MGKVDNENDLTISSQFMESLALVTGNFFLIFSDNACSIAFRMWVTLNGFSLKLKHQYSPFI